jgi:AbrB family looped-hinge helix DNA binding protein
MAIAHSKITAQGQISVPADVRKRLGVGPGSILEWEEEGGKIVVKKAGKYSSRDIRNKLFPHGPPKKLSVEEIKEAVGRGILEHYERSRH